MAAANTNAERLVQFQILLNEIEQSNPDPRIKNYCRLIKGIVSKGLPLSPNNLNTTLQTSKFSKEDNTLGVNITHKNSREISVENYANFKINLDAALQEFMKSPFHMRLKRNVLEGAITSFSDITGDKFFLRRSDVFLETLGAISFAGTLEITNEELERFLEYPQAFFTLFSPKKDVGLPGSLINNSAYFKNSPNLIGIARRQPYILAVMRRYQKFYDRDPEILNQELGTLIGQISMNTFTPFPVLKHIFSKFLPPEQLEQVFRQAELRPNSKTQVINDFYMPCTIAEIRQLPCPPGSRRPAVRVCPPPEGYSDVTPEEIRETCQPSIAGGKRTRKRRQKKRKSRRRGRSN